MDNIEGRLNEKNRSNLRRWQGIFTVEIAKLEGSENLQVGQKAYLADQFGRPFQIIVTAKDEKTITLDANSEMAGKELNFDIELVSVE